MEIVAVQDQKIADQIELILTAASRCKDGVILVLPRSYILPKSKPVGQFDGIDVFNWPSKKL